MSSSDGFCSTLSFAPGELGQTYTGPTSVTHNNATPSTPAANVTPLLTPTHSASPHVPSPIKTSHISSNSTGPAPPASPARSNSTCSVATQPSTQPTPAGVVNNPTPTLGTVPSVTATHSAQPPTLPLTTPPQTPISGGPQNGPSTTGSSVLGKRDTRPASESEKEQGKEEENNALQQPPKRRRVAPTLISSGTDGASSSKDNKS